MTENEQPILSYREQLAAIRNGTMPKTTGAKPKKFLKRVGDKKAAEIKAQKESGTDSTMDLFFQANRSKMTGRCLFCNGNTMKKDDEKFHFSLAHLLPKAIFKSVATHPDILIELCFFGESCHTIFYCN